MSNVNGVVEWKGANKFGGFSIKVDGNYYNSKFDIKCEKGDVVEFDSGSTGKYCNKLRVVTSGGGAASTPTAVASSFAGRGRGAFPIDKGDGQRSIIRQNALARAMECIGLLPDKIKTRDEIVAEAVRIAMEFERYTAGDLDREAEEEAKAKLAS